MALYLYIYTARLLMSVFLYVSTPGIHACRPPTHSAYLAPSVRAALGGACRQGVQRPTNMQPGTFCYR